MNFQLHYERPEHRAQKAREQKEKLKTDLILFISCDVTISVEEIRETAPW
jgi:hypothetical protein